MSRYPVGIPPGTQLLRVERIDGAWLMWIHNNPSFEFGTYIRLGDDGSIKRIVERPNEVDEMVIKERDK